MDGRLVPMPVCMLFNWPVPGLILSSARSLQNWVCLIRSSGLVMPSAFMKAVGTYYTWIRCFWTHSWSNANLVPTCLFRVSYDLRLRFVSAAWLSLLSGILGKVFSVVGVALVMFSITSFLWSLSSKACSAAYDTALILASLVDLAIVNCFFDFHWI